jgi:hypothetical protein
LPKERIAPDFVARMVDGVGEAAGPAPVAVMPSGFDAEALRSRLRRAPDPTRPMPPGMMSLGTRSGGESPPAEPPR